MASRDPMRRIVCPWCDGKGTYKKLLRTRTEWVFSTIGCVPCGGNELTEGTGAIGVLFQPPSSPLTPRR